MVKKKHLLYRIQEKRSGLVFWSALPPQNKTEKLLEKRILPIKENLKLSISPTDVEFIRKELAGITLRRKKKLKDVT